MNRKKFSTGHIPGAVNIEMLRKVGFNNVHDLSAITQWQAQGLPVQ